MKGEMKKNITTELSDLIHTFGYAKHPSMKDNFTGFFDYPEEEQDEQRFYSFKEHNENNIKWVCQLTDKDLSDFNFKLTDPAKDVSLINYNNAHQYLKAITHDANQKLYGDDYYQCD